LVFMLTLSGAVHLMNYYADCLRRDEPNAAERAILLGWKPCALSSITTMLGMGSLCTSQLAPVRQFGLFSAAGLGIATVVLLLGFPVVVNFICKPEEELKRIRESKDGSALGWEQRTHGWLVAYSGWVNQHAMKITSVGLLLLAVTLVGLVYLKSSTKFSDMFPLHSKTNQDMFWMEEHIGPIATVEVLLRFSKDSSATALDRASWVSKVASRLASLPEVGGVLSAGTFLPSWSESTAARAVAKRAILRNEIERAIPQLQSQGLVSVGESGSVWRVLAKVSATSDSNYGALTKAVSDAALWVIKDAPSAHGLHC
jgi:uncharacterized protein